MNDWVYFVRSRDDETSLIKIGMTTGTVPARVRGIQSMSPVPLEVLGVIPVKRGRARDVEADLHEDFDYLREHGEWFRPAEELLEYIAEFAYCRADLFNRFRIPPSLDSFPRYRRKLTLKERQDFDAMIERMCSDAVDEVDSHWEPTNADTLQEDEYETVT